MNNSNYNLFKTIKKTEQNNDNLQLIDCRIGGNILVDLTYLNSYNLPSDVIENIKTECKHLSAANTTLFVGFVQDFKAYEGILKFQCTKVYKDNGTKHCYNILTLKNIDRLNYGERLSIYNRYYTENEIHIEETNRVQSVIDIEIE